MIKIYLLISNCQKQLVKCELPELLYICILQLTAKFVFEQYLKKQIIHWIVKCIFFEVSKTYFKNCLVFSFNYLNHQIFIGYKF